MRQMAKTRLSSPFAVWMLYDMQCGRSGSRADCSQTIFVIRSRSQVQTTFGAYPCVNSMNSWILRHSSISTIVLLTKRILPSGFASETSRAVGRFFVMFSRLKPSDVRLRFSIVGS